MNGYSYIRLFSNLLLNLVAEVRLIHLSLLGELRSCCHLEHLSLLIALGQKIKYNRFKEARWNSGK